MFFRKHFPEHAYHSFRAQQALTESPKSSVPYTLGPSTAYVRLFYEESTGQVSILVRPKGLRRRSAIPGRSALEFGEHEAQRRPSFSR